MAQSYVTHEVRLVKQVHRFLVPGSRPESPGSSRSDRIDSQLAWIGLVQDRTDGLLIETLVPLTPLENFQVAADRAFSQEFGRFFASDPA
jgi:hypothetical protein